MGFSSEQFRKKKAERPWKINPVWRGIGCLLLILVPIMAWFAAVVFLEPGIRIINSPQMSNPITIKYIKVAEIDNIIEDFNQYTVSNHLVAGQFFLFFLFTVLGYGILAFIYAVLYRIAGPSRYGPFDVPPNSMRR